MKSKKSYFIKTCVTVFLVAIIFSTPLFVTPAHASFGTFVQSVFDSIFDFFFGVDPLPVPTPLPSESGKTLGVPGTPSVEEDEQTTPQLTTNTTTTETVYKVVNNIISESSIITQILGIVNQSITDRFNNLSADLFQKISDSLIALEQKSLATSQTQSPIVYYTAQIASPNRN